MSRLLINGARDKVLWFYIQAVLHHEIMTKRLILQIFPQAMVTFLKFSATSVAFFQRWHTASTYMRQREQSIVGPPTAVRCYQRSSHGLLHLVQNYTRAMQNTARFDAVLLVSARPLPSFVVDSHRCSSCLFASFQQLCGGGHVPRSVHRSRLHQHIAS